MKKIIIAVIMLATTSVFAQTGNAQLDSLNNEKNTVVLQQKLKKLGSGTEKELITVMNFYMYNQTKRDSVEKLTLQRFPKGDFAFGRALRNMYKEDDPEKREQALTKLKPQFPERNMDQGNYTVSDAYAKEKNLAKTREYISKIENISSRGMAIGMNAQVILKYDPAAAEALLKPEMERLAAAGVPQEAGPRGRYFAFSNLYGNILVKEGKYKEALKYVKEAYDQIKRRDELLSGNYGLVMNYSGQYQEALPVLQKLVDDDKADKEVKRAFAESYEKLNKGKSASEYLHYVEIALKAKMEAAVAKMLINEPAPDFIVTDIEGKKVSLADFKGKTIVIDFWATWCGPCKASFPSMQRLVNSYQKDASVKFLFIHTLESVADPLSDAKKYLSVNNYKFDLYMDVKDVKTNKNEAVKAFDVKGIPAKFIIDGKGNIRFKVVGFSGSDDSAVAEMSTMIDIVRKNS